MNKKLCFVIPGFVTKETGGAELQVYMLSEALIKKGWNIEVITLNDLEGNNNRNPEYFNPKIKYHYYNKGKFRFLEFFYVFFKLLKTRSKYYYQRTAYAHTGALAIYTRLFRKKMIYAIAGDDELFKYINYNNLKRKDYNKVLKYWIRKTDMFIVDSLILFGIRRAHLVLSQTTDQQTALKENIGVNSTVVRNSMNMDIPSPVDKENVVLWVGNLRRVKQPEAFIELAKELKNENLKFVMIGAAREKEYFNISDNNKSVSNFEFLGQKPFNETMQYINQAKVIVNTSYSEGFSNTFIQAWLTKTIVVSLNVNPDNIFTNLTLGKYANGDFKKLTSMIAKSANNYELETQLLENARNFAINEFNIENNIIKLEEIFENI